MKREDKHFLLLTILFVTALALAGYYLDLRIYEKTTVPNFLKSPNEVKSDNKTADQ